MYKIRGRILNSRIETIESKKGDTFEKMFITIEETESGVYIIQAYDGNITIRAEEMKKMSAEQVQSALVFFYHLGKELSLTLPLYLMDRLKEMNQQLQQSHSQKSGGTSE